MIQIKNLSYSVGTKVIVDKVSCEFEKGKLYSIVGANGAGKSSLVKSILQINSFTGSVLINEKNINELERMDISKLVSYVPQIPFIQKGLRVDEFLFLSRHPFRESYNGDAKELINNILKRLDLEGFESRLLDDLSGGELQRIQVAGSIIQDTPFIFLDEPLSYLDPSQQVRLLRILKKEKEDGRSIILVSHDLNSSLLFTDELIGMKNGSILTIGSPKKVINQGFLTELYGPGLNLINIPGTDLPIIVPVLEGGDE